MKYIYDYPRPAVTADIVVWRNYKGHTEVLLIRRKHFPFEGMWALPGGFMNMDETLEQAAARELLEETGIAGIMLEQIHTYSEPNRDPRHRTITTVFAGRLDRNYEMCIAGDDAAALGWFDIEKLPPLAFDHGQIVQESIRRYAK